MAFDQSNDFTPGKEGILAEIESVTQCTACFKVRPQNTEWKQKPTNLSASPCVENVTTMSRSPLVLSRITRGCCAMAFPFQRNEVHPALGFYKHTHSSKKISRL